MRKVILDATYIACVFLFRVEMDEQTGTATGKHCMQLLFKKAQVNHQSDAAHVAYTLRDKSGRQRQE